MYRMILVPCLIFCPANSPCPAMRDGPIRTRIFTRGCLLGCADVLPVLSSLDSAASNIGALRGRRTAFPGEVDAVRCCVNSRLRVPLDRILPQDRSTTVHHRWQRTLINGQREAMGLRKMVSGNGND